MRQISPVKAHCVRLQYGREAGEDEMKTRRGSELTGLASGEDMKHEELKVMGFNLSLVPEVGVVSVPSLQHHELE